MSQGWAFVPKRTLIASTLLLAPTLCFPAAGLSTTGSPKPGEPTDPKARKTYAEAFAWLEKGAKLAAVDTFRKANKQDGGHCSECLNRAYTLAISIGDYKDAADIARDWLPLAQTDLDKAALHYRIGVALQQQGIESKKDKCFDESCDEFKAALQLQPIFAAVHYSLGITLAHQHQDEAARTEFAAFLDQDVKNPEMHERAARYKERIELARARLAPAFSVTTLDGQHVTMDSLAGKVVLIDFWATWCGPCREALPHIREIANEYRGSHFVVLSVSLDKDMEKWRSFVNKNQMTWLQYRDDGFDGDIAKLFHVNAIPATFTIDADGVVEDQHVGDAEIEQKLKKLIARAIDMASHTPTPSVSDKPGAAAN